MQEDGHTFEQEDDWVRCGTLLFLKEHGLQSYDDVVQALDNAPIDSHFYVVLGELRVDIGRLQTQCYECSTRVHEQCTSQEIAVQKAAEENARLRAQVANLESCLDAVTGDGDDYIDLSSPPALQHPARTTTALHTSDDLLLQNAASLGHSNSAVEPITGVAPDFRPSLRNKVKQTVAKQKNCKKTRAKAKPKTDKKRVKKVTTGLMPSSPELDRMLVRQAEIAMETSNASSSSSPAPRPRARASARLVNAHAQPNRTSVMGTHSAPPAPALPPAPAQPLRTRETDMENFRRRQALSRNASHNASRGDYAQGFAPPTPPLQGDQLHTTTSAAGPPQPQMQPQMDSMMGPRSAMQMYIAPAASQGAPAAAAASHGPTAAAVGMGGITPHTNNNNNVRRATRYQQPPSSFSSATRRSDEQH
jgi:hypothetical protein